MYQKESKILYYVSDSNDAATNMATEYYLFHEYSDNIFYLWVNGPTIVVGKHQNTIEEINSEYVKENDIKVMRRISGGGAVYHDKGNLNYTIISGAKEEKINFSSFSTPIEKSLEQMGINAIASGRNDITVDGFKICGNAQYIKNNRVMHHGCILFDVDLSVLANALKVSKDKIESKGIKSVRARVKNITDFLEKDYTMDDFMSIITKNINDEYPNFEEIVFTEEDKKRIEEIRQTRYLSWDWVYGESPKCNIVRKRKLSSGNFEARINVEDGCITDLKIFGDFFGIGDVEEVEKKLIGVRYEDIDIEKILEDIDIKKIFSVSKEEFKTLII